MQVRQVKRTKDNTGDLIIAEHEERAWWYGDPCQLRFDTRWKAVLVSHFSGLVCVSNPSRGFRQAVYGLDVIVG